MSKAEKYNENIKKLDELQYKVTQESATERPFTGEYDDSTKPEVGLEKIIVFKTLSGASISY